MSYTEDTLVQQTTTDVHSLIASLVFPYESEFTRLTDKGRHWLAQHGQWITPG